MSAELRYKKKASKSLADFQSGKISFSEWNRQQKSHVDEFQASAIAPVDRSHDEVRAIILANGQNPAAGTFDGLSSSEIASWNRRMMFGENDEAFPSQEEWSSIVD